MRTAVDLDTGATLDQTVIADLFTRSGLTIARVDLLLGGNHVDTLDVTSGSVTFSRSAQQYGRLSGLEVDADVADLPTVTGGRLTPSGWEVRVWAGMRLYGRVGDELAVWLLDENGVVVTTEGGEPIYVDTTTVPPAAGYIDAVVPLITAPLESSQVDAFGVVGVDAWDRSSLLAADLLTSTLVWPGDNTTLEAAVDDLVHRTFPSITTQFSGTTHTCPTEAFERDASPLQIIVDAATSVGCFARFDGYGNFLWSPEPDLSTAQPVAEFVEGAGGTLVNLTATVANRDVYNAWTVIGKNPDTETTTDIVATVYDDTPGSVTQWGGLYGRRPKRAVRMELVDTQAKADEAARTMRAAEIGFGVELDLTVVPHYLIEPADAVTVARAAAGIDGVALVDDQTVTLGPGAMRLGCRARQVTE